MSLGIGITFGVVYLLTVAAFCLLLYRMRQFDAQQQDLLLERIQRPEQRPVTPIPFDPDNWEPDKDRTDLVEMAAIGMIDPTLEANRES